MPVIINPINIFDTSFFNLPHIEFSTSIIGIGNKFILHPLYQAVPEGVPHGAEIVEVGTRYHDLNYAVMAGDSSKKVERDAYRDKSVLTTSLALNWAGIRCLRENNLELITNLGVESKKKPQREMFRTCRIRPLVHVCPPHGDLIRFPITARAEAIRSRSSRR